ncbi:MAG: hypothetical protein Q8N88_01900, partial [Nanoarchaeota archaeon]|nr:hypothetical protein [Nanoarchaeota archaeon]
IRTGSDAIEGTVDSNGILVALWTITADDLLKASDLDDFIFRVTGLPTSSKLKISKPANDDNLTLELIPNCGDYFNTSQSFNITVNATDADDEIIGKITVQKENSSAIINTYTFTFTNGLTSFPQVLNLAGNYRIVAEGTNSRGIRARKISNIMIIDPTVNGRYVAACITQPIDYSYLATGVVKFNATGTTGISYTVPGIYSRIPKEEIEFYWEFSDGRISPYIGPDPLSNEFHKVILSVRDTWAILNAKLKS